VIILSDFFSHAKGHSAKKYTMMNLRETFGLIADLRDIQVSSPIDFAQVPGVRCQVSGKKPVYIRPIHNITQYLRI